MSVRSLSLGILLAVGGAGVGVHAAELVKNGDFEMTTAGGGQLGFNTDATDWTTGTTSYNFLFPSGTADGPGVTGQFGNLQLWGPGNGAANGLPASSPNGGNFVGMDGAFQQGPLSQTIDGLTVGQTYAVSFDWAGAQQFTIDGENTEQMQVSLGSETHSTAVYDNSSHGFSGWMSKTFDFTATSTSEVLSFLAIGTPIAPSVPPFSLLDSVSMEAAVPEPSTWAMMLLGLAGLGYAGFRRGRRTSSAIARG
jgi:hypothetical protein